MKKHVKEYASHLILIGIIIFLGVRYRTLAGESTGAKVNTTSITASDITVRDFEQILNKQWILEDNIFGDSVVFRNTLGQQVVLWDSVQALSSPRLVLYFSHSTCEDCQLQELAMIDSLFKREEVIVLMKFPTEREFLAYRSQFEVKYRSYRIEGNQSLFAGFEEPFNDVLAFVPSSSRSARYVHLGRGNYPELSWIYYKLIKEKLFN